MMKNFIIVGNGLAATTLMHQFQKSNLSFHVVSNSELSRCSQVAAGIWNPIVFKRMTESWNAKLLIDYLIEFYSECEKRLNLKLITHRKLIKPFKEEQEKVLWMGKSKNELEEFLSDEIFDANDELQNFKIENQFGIVKQAGNLDVSLFIEASKTYFNDNFVNETFDYSQLKIEENFIAYKKIKAEKIVFCEGHLVKHNPYFYWLPMLPAQGEIVTIETDKIKCKNFIFNHDGFLMDIGNNLFKIGATYNWKNLNDDTSQEGFNVLQQKLSKMISCNYKITKHEAGVRPSSKDRRPLIGAHPKFKNLYVFNGLGTKGVMLSPFFSQKFVHFCLQNQSLNPQVDIKRFYHLYES